MNNEKASSAGCNCRNKNNCPLDNQCLTTATIYQAKVFEPGKDDDPKVYVGMAESEFKTRFYNHTLSFKNKDYANKTALSKFIWDLKKTKRDYEIKWSILKQAKPYASGTRVCKLCLAKNGNSKRSQGNPSKQTIRISITKMSARKQVLCW